MLDRFSLKSRERFLVDGRPWEISLRWEEGCDQRPYKVHLWRNSFFSLTFSDSDWERYFLKLYPDDLDGCGLYLGDRDTVKLLGECTTSCKEAIQGTPHTLTLKGEYDSITAFVDGSLCSSALVAPPIKELTVELSTTANSCVGFDDIVIRVENAESGWATLLEDHFEANLLQTEWLDSMLDLDSRRSRIAVTWAVLAVALLIDFAALILFGRRSPLKILLVFAMPQAMAILALQNILLLPLVPLLCCVGAVWLSKGFLSFFGDIQKGPWLYSAKKTRLLFWFTLCVIQAMHWLWFRKIWIFIEYETVALASLIPAILILGPYMGAIRMPAWLRSTVRLLTACLLVLSMELTIRSTPLQYLLDFEWRISKSFWQLERHTNLTVDHSKKEVFEDDIGNFYSREKPEEVFRIVCLGSSSTQGTFAVHRELESYPVQLDFLLERCSPGSFEVINAGMCGYRLTQLRIYFEQILSGLAPDLLILYFGDNGYFPSDLEYYKRVESLLKANPTLLTLHNQSEIKASLSLRWPHPALIKGYIFMARSRLFIGMKLLIDGFLSDRFERMADTHEKKFSISKSADLLVKAALKNGVAVLLIPEIMSDGSLACESDFEKIADLHKSEPVHLLKIENFDTSAYLVDYCHMNAQGYHELARIISDYLVDSGLVECTTNE